MKKNIIITLAIGLILGLAQIGYAKYIGGFKVIEVTENLVVIKQGDAEPVTVNIKGSKFKVGDKVKFDADKGKVRKYRKNKIVGGC